MKPSKVQTLLWLFCAAAAVACGVALARVEIREQLVALHVKIFEKSDSGNSDPLAPYQASLPSSLPHGPARPIKESKRVLEFCVSMRNAIAQSRAEYKSAPEIAIARVLEIGDRLVAAQESVTECSRAWSNYLRAEARRWQESDCRLEDQLKLAPNSNLPPDEKARHRK